MNAHLPDWTRDGRGEVLPLGGDAWEVRVESPLTLWCPDEAAGPVEMSFEGHLLTPNSGMLVMACARPWRGPPMGEVARAGAYDDYNAGDLEMYTVGFNRTGHVSTEVQPNASTANFRRIGGPGGVRYSSDKLRMGRPDADRALWAEWDARTLLGSVSEFASGTAHPFAYRFVFSPPRITMCLEGRELCSVADPHPGPLVGGRFGVRCMTPGAVFRLRALRLRPLPP